MKFNFTLIAALLFFASCGQEQMAIPQSAPYFNLSTYFETQIQNLKDQQPMVQKTVSINGQSELKQVKISDWKEELNMFFGADINKADWKGAFNKTTTDSTESYQTEHEKIFVKRLDIKFDDRKDVQEIKIIIERNNLIYLTKDTLLYIPNTLYSIKKHQKIKLLEPRSYSIEGTILH